MRLRFFIVWFSCGMTAAGVQAQQKLITGSMYHLRNGHTREWSSFPEQPRDSQLVLNFKAAKNVREATLVLRQYDVAQPWNIRINDQDLGHLVIDEKDMISYFTVPANVLKDQGNELKIMSPSAVTDDILVGNIQLNNLPLSTLRQQATVEVEVHEPGTERLLPSRITITDRNGSLMPVYAAPHDKLAVRTGVIYTGTGKATFSVPPGNYTIYASRGFEYGVDSVKLKVRRGERVQKILSVEHEVNPAGWISSDPHVHTYTYSRHGDASVAERILTIAGEGLQMPVITDHNITVDIRDTIEKIGMKGWFTPVMGNEITTRVGHFNVFPVNKPGKTNTHEVNDWNQLGLRIKELDGVRVVVLNHARDIHAGFRPFDSAHHLARAGKSLLNWKLPANAMEVLNSGSQQTMPEQLYHDWMGMLNRGIILAPVASSDAHEVSRFLVGQGRTYIRDTDPLKNFAEGKVSASFGLLTTMIVNDRFGPGETTAADDNLSVQIKVMAPSWLQADMITLYADGIKIREQELSPKKTGGIKWQVTWKMRKPAHDVILVAVAEGPGKYLPWWPISKPFQHDSPSFRWRLMGITGAVKVDADGDGKFSTPYDYATQLWENSKGNLETFIKALDSYDEAVSTQAAVVLMENNVDTSRDEFRKILFSATEKVKKGLLTR